MGSVVTTTRELAMNVMVVEVCGGDGGGSGRIWSGFPLRSPQDYIYDTIWATVVSQYRVVSMTKLGNSNFCGIIRGAV